MPTRAAVHLYADSGIDTASESGQGAAPAADGPRRVRRPQEVVVVPKLTPTPLDELETPDLVREMVGRIIDLPPTRAKAYEREFKLSYHFEGWLVALAPGTRGPLVVASGPEKEVLDILAGLPDDAAEAVTLVTPQPLRDVIAGFAKTARRAHHAGR